MILPKLSNAKMRQMLALPKDKLRVVIDTDAKNEVDDQFALTWALLSQDQLEIEGMYAAPYSRLYHREPLLRAYQQVINGRLGQVTDGENVSWGGSYHDWARRLIQEGRTPNDIHFISPSEGTQLSYEEILKIYELLEEDATDKVHLGSAGFLTSLDAPYRSEAAQHLIERAMVLDARGDERPLYVIALAALTNIVSAILLEPRIIERIVVVWTAAYPSFVKLSNRPSMNLIQDLIASRYLFDCGVPHVYMPGYYMGNQLTLSLPESEAWVKDRGKIGDYLHHLYLNNPIYEQRGIREHVGRTWIAWDLICIAWLLNPNWVPTQLLPAPILDENMYWHQAPNGHLMREATGINRDAIFRDFFRKLEKAPR
ncbi:MAG: nucleoside hydrolase [Chloroflexota bacterium]